jgi:hypothetical protein
MRPGRVLLALVILLGVSAFTASMLMVVYPGSFKLTAPLLCPADQPDPFVVRYSYQTSDGTSTNFTLFCMGERGQFTEAGTWVPLALLTGFVTAGLVGATAALAVLAHLSRRRRPDRPEGAPVDAPVAPVDAPVDAPVHAPIVDPPLP